MLFLNSPNHLTFDVNVQGTADVPVVKCVLGESPSLSFDATALGNGSYEVNINLAENISTGSHQLKIEVLINGRLFTPISTTIEVSAAKAVPATDPVIEVKNVEVKKPEAAKSILKDIEKPAQKLETPISKLFMVAAKETSRKNKPATPQTAAPKVLLTPSRSTPVLTAMAAASKKFKPLSVTTESFSHEAVLVKGSIIYK